MFWVFLVTNVYMKNIFVLRIHSEWVWPLIRFIRKNIHDWSLRLWMWIQYWSMNVMSPFSFFCWSHFHWHSSNVCELSYRRYYMNWHKIPIIWKWYPSMMRYWFHECIHRTYLVTFFNWWCMFNATTLVSTNNPPPSLMFFLLLK